MELMNHHIGKELEKTLNEKIDIFIINTHGRKHNTIVKGFYLDIAEDRKKFIKDAKNKLSTTVFEKLIPEYHKSKEVIVCFGKKGEEIKEFLMTHYQKSEDIFEIHNK